MGKKFVASYSGGKDGAFAIYKAMIQGMAPLALITTFSIDLERSWFHYFPEALLKEVADSIGAPLWLIRTDGAGYEDNFEKTLRLAKESGADVCVFGDIDIEEHINWCTGRCVSAGIEAMFPLYGQGREAIVDGFIGSGFIAYFTIIDTTKINAGLLGKALTKETARELRAQGADICGENGEYHTFVADGPIFARPVEFTFGEKIYDNGRVILPVKQL